MLQYDCAFVVQPGDKILKVSASFGNDIWDAINYGQVMYAIKTRNGQVYMKLQSNGGDVSVMQVSGCNCPCSAMSKLLKLLQIAPVTMNNAGGSRAYIPSLHRQVRHVSRVLLMLTLCNIPRWVLIHVILA